MATLLVPSISRYKLVHGLGLALYQYGLFFIWSQELVRGMFLTSP
jgi:hypothetical protein